MLSIFDISEYNTFFLLWNNILENIYLFTNLLDIFSRN